MLLCAVHWIIWFYVSFSFRERYMLKDSFCFLINCVKKTILPFRLEALMCCTATMPMVKKMKIFKDAVIGCLKSECVKKELFA